MGDSYTPLDSVELADILRESRLSPLEEKVSWKRLDWDCPWQEAMSQVGSIADILNYLSGHLSYDAEKNRQEKPGYDSFAAVHGKGKGLCWDYAVSAAALGTSLGLRPLVLFAGGDAGGGWAMHAVHLYAKSGRWGTLGTDCLPPMFDSISSVVKGLERRCSARLFGKPVEFPHYAVIDLDREFGSEWLDSEEDLYRAVIMAQVSSCKC